MKCANCDKFMGEDNVHHCHHGTFCSKKCKSAYHLKNKIPSWRKIKKCLKDKQGVKEKT